MPHPQPTLWSSTNTRREHLARASDPQSSHAAAAKAKASGLVRGHEALILTTLLAADGPMNAHQIGACCGLTNVQVCRRLGELGRLRVEKLVRPATLKINGLQAFEAVREG